MNVTPLALRPFATPEDLLLDALPLMRRPDDLSVTDAAERYVRVQTQGAWQAFDRSVTPYMVEPADTVMSRLYRATAFVGPSQSGKTMALQLCAAHAIKVVQREVLIVHMSRPERDKWVEQKLNPMILSSPALRDALGDGSSDDTFSRKRFKGMRLILGYPTPQTLSGGTYALVLLTDYDHMPAVLGTADNPEGTPYRMSRNRTRSYLSGGHVWLESSPAWPVVDPDWQPSVATPHMLPPVESGIVPIYNEGTRARWYWECKDCGEEFEPRFDRLKYDPALSPGLAGEQAVMICPECGCETEQRHKVELNRAALNGRGGWRHETDDGQRAALGDAAVRRSDVVSYALNGAAATFANWIDLVSAYEHARRKVETLGDDTDLATVFYTDIGLPYQRQRQQDDQKLTSQFLRDHAHAEPKGHAPEWARFITISVDVQATYFVVQAMAWGPGGMAQIIDRFDLTQPVQEAAQQDRRLDPAKYAEDWDVLIPLAEKVYPVAGACYGLRPVAVSVDFQGAPGVSDNAEAFWQERRRKGGVRRWYLTRGQGGWKTPGRVWLDTPERRSGGGKARKIKLLTIATDRVKDTVWAMMVKADGATGGLYLASWMTDDQVAEAMAEERTGKGWVSKKGQKRNETFDLAVQSRAVAEHEGLLKINWDAPPDWASGGTVNPRSVLLDGADKKEAVQPPRRRGRTRGKLF